MAKNDQTTRDRLTRSLGASRVVPLPHLRVGGPLDLLQLRAEVVGRLKSTGGRPTDPDWDVQRLVPFRGEIWKQLEELAGRLSTEGRKVSAGQLAAILLERALSGVEPDNDQR